MPELPEAETIARELRSAIRGQLLRLIRLERPDILHGDAASLSVELRNRKVIDVSRRGKRVIISFDHDAALVFALGMTGRITIEQATDACLAHTHLRITFGDGTREIRFRDPRRFGGVWFLNGACGSHGRPLSPLGDEPLEMNIKRFRKLLQRGRQIKALLLDQRIIAGLGNIYCDEALHRSRIHPRTRASDLAPEQTAILLRQIRAVLRSAINCGGSTLMDYRNTNGQPGWFQEKHRVYNRRGEPCRRCKTPIERIIVASRSTHLCPNCQPPR